MSFTQEPAYLGAFPIAADAPAVERIGFIKKTYGHLLGAVFAFVVMEAALFSLPGIDEMVASMVRGRAWLLVLGSFILVNYIAERWARSTTSIATQYLGLGVYVIAEAITFLPLLWIAARYGGQNVIPAAAVLTLTLFTGLSAFVFLSRKDFSFLGGALWIAGLAAFGLCVVSVLFGFSLGILFTVAMIALASGYILYDTSNVIHHYRVGQHVAASLALFAAVALMFWYVLRLVMSISNRR